MDDTNRGAFNYDLDQLARKFGATVNNETWWMMLQLFAYQDVAAALRVAADTCPEMPEPAVVRQMAAKAEQERKLDAEAREAANKAPPGKEEFNALAEGWKDESLRLGLAGRPTPHNVFEARMKEFWELFGRVFEGKEV